MVKTTLACFRCRVCQHKPSSKDEWEMSEEKETFAKGMSFCSLLEMYEIYHRKKHISHFFASFFSCLYTLKPFLLDCIAVFYKKGQKNKTKGNETIPHCLLFSSSHIRTNQGRFAFFSLFRGRLSTWGGLSVSNIIFSYFALSPFSVGAVSLSQHGKILDEILDELLTRKYKLILVTLHNSPPCSARAFFCLLISKSPASTPASARWDYIFLRRGCWVSVLSASSRTASPPGPTSLWHTHTHMQFIIWEPLTPQTHRFFFSFN